MRRTSIALSGTFPKAGRRWNFRIDWSLFTWRGDSGRPSDPPRWRQGNRRSRYDRNSVRRDGHTVPTAGNDAGADGRALRQEQLAHRASDRESDVTRLLEPRYPVDQLE